MNQNRFASRLSEAEQSSDLNNHKAFRKREAFFCVIKIELFLS